MAFFLKWVVFGFHSTCHSNGTFICVIYEWTSLICCWIEVKLSFSCVWRLKFPQSKEMGSLVSKKTKISCTDALSEMRIFITEDIHIVIGHAIRWHSINYGSLINCLVAWLQSRVTWQPINFADKQTNLGLIGLVSSSF